MQVIHIPASEKDRFNQFVLAHPLGSIQQTFDWGIFQEKVPGRGKFWALAVTDKQNEIRGTALLIRQKLPLGLSWLYCARGPLSTVDTPVWEALISEIKKIARQAKAVFLRVDPYIEFAETQNLSGEASAKPDFASLRTPPSQLLPHFRSAHANYQPEWTIKLDLTKTEDELLKGMKPKGRYNIKLAEKNGIKIYKIGPDLSAEQAIETFYQLLNQTTTRDQFSGHPKDYYQSLIETIPPSGSAKSYQLKAKSFSSPASQIYIAYYQNSPLAALIATFFKDTATYYFGASSSVNRQMMAPYLLHWQAILDAKKAGYHFYDLFGIAPANEPNHALAGVTAFKKKFGGTIYHYAPAQEYVFKPIWYWLMMQAKR